MTLRLNNILKNHFSKIAAGLVATAVLYASTEYVPEHHVGVETFNVCKGYAGRVNAVKGERPYTSDILQPGWHLKAPWSHYTEFPDQNIEYSVLVVASCITADDELVAFACRATVSLPPEDIVTGWYRHVSDNYTNCLLRVCKTLSLAEIAANPQGVVDRAYQDTQPDLWLPNGLSARLVPFSTVPYQTVPYQKDRIAETSLGFKVIPHDEMPPLNYGRIGEKFSPRPPSDFPFFTLGS